MLVLRGTTPYEARDSIVEFLESEAARHKRSAETNLKKREAAQDMARCNAIRNAALMLKDAAFEDIRGNLIPRVVIKTKET